MAITITVNDLTNQNGEGVFDKIAIAMKGQLQEEFSAGRITGTDYSKVFVTSLDNAMAQSIQFLLQKDITAQQVALLEAQTALALSQKAVADKQIELTDKEILKLDREIELMDDQEALIEAQALLTQNQATKVNKEIEVLDVEKTKLTGEVSLIAAQTAQANKQTEVLTAQLVNIPKEGQLIDKQVLKAQSETSFLDQRIKTEKAQILDTVDGAAIAGVIGKQKELYQAQSDGFKRDAEQKLTKMLIDTWSVRRSTDDGTVADNVNKLSDANIGAAVSKCMAGINVTPV